MSKFYIFFVYDLLISHEMELAVVFLKLNKYFHVFSASMPGERLVIRDAAEVGRFPGAAPPTRVELTIHKEREKKEEDGGCRRWFRKAFPCCCKSNASYDITDKVELVTPPTPPVLPEPPKPKPENGEAREMEGNIFRVTSIKSPVNVNILTQTQTDDKL